jgi:hypothetical protein
VSEPWGFRVQLASLETFAEAVRTTRDEYAAMNGQLAAADPAQREATLYGLVMLPGSRAVDEKCHAVVTAYKSLYSKVAWAQTVIKAQLDVIAANVTETHQLYSDVETRHEAMFRGLLAGDLGERPGPDDGPA